MKEFHWTLLRLLVGALVIHSSTGSYINAPCSTQTDCGALLECLEGVCQCDSLNEIYDASTNQCLLLVGRDCGDDDGRKCVPHADCSRSMCRCKSGYRMSADFLCKPDFGSPCRKSQQDDDCDETQGLVCVQGTCHCFNSTWTFQGQFGCVDPNSQQFNEMMSLLNQTQVLLKENGLEIRDVFDDLGLQNDPSSEAIFGNMLAEARQFQHDTYNTNDLQFAAQNQSPQQSGGSGGGGNGFNIGQLLNTFQTLSNLFGGRNNNNNNQGGGGGGGGGGFFRNLFGGGGGGNQGSGYSEGGSGYPASGQPAEMNQGQRFNLINSFLNLFNQLIPIVRQLRMRFSPVRFFQNLLNRFAPSSSTTTTAAPAAAIQQGPPTVIQHNGNFNSNPIFDGQQSSGGGGDPNNQGQGTFRFFMRTRERFRNALRGGSGSAGGYDYTPAKPPGKYGPPPANNYGPPESTPAEGAEQPAGASQQGFYVNQQQQQQNHQAQAQNHGTTSSYNTLPVSHSPVTQGQGQHSPAPAPAPAQRQLQQQNFGGLPSPTTFNSGQHPNHQSFFNQATQTQPPQAQNQQQYKTHDNSNFNNNNNNHPQQQQPQQQNYNTAATSHQQTTFVPHPQPNHVHHQPQNHHNNVQYIYNNRRPEVGSETTNLNVAYPSSPPPIPQFKLQIQSSHHTPAAVPTSNKENISQNFILSEADDPHPGFTPHSSQSPPSSSENTHQGSYRTAARFERIGHEEEPTTVVSTAAQNWRDSF